MAQASFSTGFPGLTFSMRPRHTVHPEHKIENNHPDPMFEASNYLAFFWRV
jgi:hypothetical protein